MKAFCSVSRVLACLVIGSLVQRSLQAQDFSQTLAFIKNTAKKAKDYTEPFSDAVSAVQTAQKILQILGILDTSTDIDSYFQQTSMQLQQSTLALMWQISESQLNTYHPPAVTAMDFYHSKAGTLTCVRAAANSPARCSDQMPQYQKDFGDIASANYANAMADATSDLFFYRDFTKGQPAGYPSSDQQLMDLVGFTKADIYYNPFSNLMYDWRVIVPHLMEAISWRILWMAFLDPNFRNDGMYNEPLTRYRNALNFHYRRMLKGQWCGYSNTSGGGFPDFGQRPLPLTFCTDLFTAGENIAAVTLPDGTFQGGERALKTAMPLYEMKAMIDLLSVLVHPDVPDLAQTRHDVPSYSSPSLCLTVGQDLLDPVTGVVMRSCDPGSAGQGWFYDRQTETLRNPYSSAAWVGVPPGSPPLPPQIRDVCLEVDTMNFLQGSAGRVSTAPCSGDDAQRWTYDPESHIVTSTLNTALQINVAEHVGLPPGTPPLTNHGVDADFLPGISAVCSANSICTSFSVPVSLDQDAGPFVAAPEQQWAAGSITGDLNGDGIVDCSDLNVVTSTLGKITGQTGFDRRADYNGDGVIDIRDLAFMAQQLPAGSSCR